MIRPKKKTEDLLLSMTKNRETLIEQTHRKPEETLEPKMTKPRETFPFNPPIEVKEDWMIESTDLEVYTILFLIQQKKKQTQTLKISG